MGVVVFNGVSSKDFGIEVATFPDYPVAKRKYRDIEIPGRNGPLHLDENTFENVERTYTVSFLARGDKANNSFRAVSAAIAEWLGSVSGYAVLEDSYDPEHFVYARFVDELSITNIYNEAGTFQLKFDCRPQRFLKSGAIPIAVSSGITLYNPTKFDAKPLIQVAGSGTAVLHVGSRSVSINMSTYRSATIDSEKQKIYTGATDLEPFTTLSGGGFPILQNGASTVTFTNMTSVQITPNWWTL